MIRSWRQQSTCNCDSCLLANFETHQRPHHPWRPSPSITLHVSHFCPSKTHTVYTVIRIQGSRIMALDWVSLSASTLSFRYACALGNYITTKRPAPYLFSYKALSNESYAPLITTSLSVSKSNANFNLLAASLMPS